MYFLDKQRVYHSILNVNNNYTKRRWSIKQSKRKRKRVGEGYQSGAYSHVSNLECCALCGGDDNSGVLCSGKGSCNVQVFDWISCDVCDKWFHVFCLNNINVVVGRIDADEIWICPKCNRC